MQGLRLRDYTLFGLRPGQRIAKRGGRAAVGKPPETDDFADIVPFSALTGGW